MKLVTFIPKGKKSPTALGAVVDDKIINLNQVLKKVSSLKKKPFAIKAAFQGREMTSVKDLLCHGQGGLDLAQKLIRFVKGEREKFQKAKEKIFYKRSQVVLLPPVPQPDLFICIGRNYRSHITDLIPRGLVQDDEIPRVPTGFVKFSRTVVGDDAAVARPEGITSLDYEPEMCFVIKKRAFQVKADMAMEYVAGLMLLNDLSAREVQKIDVDSGNRIHRGKNMPGFGPVGPYLVTLDEIGEPANLWLTCKVNGEERIRVNTDDLIFKIPEIIEHYSKHMPLEPGDIFSTGAPGGVAVGQPNAAELYLKPGDVVEVSLDKVGTLRTRIVAP